MVGGRPRSGWARHLQLARKEECMDDDDIIDVLSVSDDMWCDTTSRLIRQLVVKREIMD